MALITPVSGAYTGTYGGDKIGILSDDGYELSFTPKGQDISDTDQYGMTLIDGIFRGIDWKCRFRTKEWDTSASPGLFNIIEAFGSAGGTAPSPAIGVVGVTYVSLSDTLILTAVAGTPAAASPATLTATQSLPSINNNFTMNFTSKVREVPVELILIPYADSAIVVPFTTT